MVLRSSAKSRDACSLARAVSDSTVTLRGQGSCRLACRFAFMPGRSSSAHRAQSCVEQLALLCRLPRPCRGTRCSPLAHSTATLLEMTNEGGSRAKKRPSTPAAGDLRHDEAVRILHRRARRLLVLLVTVFALATLLFGAATTAFGPSGDRGWVRTSLAFAILVVGWGGAMWFISGRVAVRPMRAALKTTTLVQAHLATFSPPDRVVVRPNGGETLTWRVLRSNDRPLKAGDEVWVASPATVGESLSLVVRRDDNDVVLWPSEPAQHA